MLRAKCGATANKKGKRFSEQSLRDHEASCMYCRGDKKGNRSTAYYQNYEDKYGKFYVVWLGHKPGVYSNWASCAEQVLNFPGAKYKSFIGKDEAYKAYSERWQDHIYGGPGLKRMMAEENSQPIDLSKPV